MQRQSNSKASTEDKMVEFTKDYSRVYTIPRERIEAEIQSNWRPATHGRLVLACRVNYSQAYDSAISCLICAMRVDHRARVRRRAALYVQFLGLFRLHLQFCMRRREKRNPLNFRFSGEFLRPLAVAAMARSGMHSCMHVTCAGC